VSVPVALGRQAVNGNQYGLLSVLVGGVIGNVLGGAGCIGDPTGRLLAYCEERSGGSVGAREALAFLVPPVLTAIAGVVGAKRGRYRVVLIATAVLLPLAVFLPLLWWE
jgi:hypothetical protein